MATLSRTQKDTLESKLQRLGERVDAQRIDDFLDEIFRQIGTLKRISCTLTPDAELLVKAHDGPVAAVHLPRAKNVLRLMCARLAVRSAEWAKREVSPYGDSVAVELPDLPLPCKVSFENTSDVQRFHVSQES